MNKKSRIIGFRVTKEMYSRIEGEAKSFNLPVSMWLRHLVIDNTKHENKPDMLNNRPNKSLQF
jgi:mobilization protein NikA